MEFINSIFTNQLGLKTDIIKKLKTYSEIKHKYALGDVIYRTGRIEHFSQNANKFGLHGVTKARISEHPINDDEIPKEEIIEPVWFTPYLEVAKGYCYNELNNWEKNQELYKKLNMSDEEFIKIFPKPSDCETYSYVPNDMRRDKKLLFLDLTGTPTDEVGRFFLDGMLMKKIYDVILQKHIDSIHDDDEDPSNKEKRWMCVDNPCNNPFTIKEIRDAYGYEHGLRDSEMYIDRFFTVELFTLLKELRIEEENNCIIMGYFHGDIFTGTYENRKYDIDGFFPAEFTIQQRHIVNKFRIKHIGLVTSQQTRKRKRSVGSDQSSSKSIKVKGGNIQKRKKKKEKTYRIKYNKNKKHI